MDIAIVGGGWAGLSAALTAVKLGHNVQLFESASMLGGRARSVQAPSLGTEIDNGQHILLGAYTATLDLMRALGLDPEQQFIRLPLSVHSADGALHMRATPGLPAPFHIVGGLLSARGLSWREKRAALRAMSQLRRAGWRVPRWATVQEWLALTRQPQRLQRLIWAPLCIATLNTPVDQACAQLFAHVLRDSLGSATRRASDMLIPRPTLTDLWPSRLADLARSDALGTAHTARLRLYTSTTVRSLRYAGRASPRQTAAGDHTHNTDALPARLVLDERSESYDAVIVCGNTPSTERLLATLPALPASEAFLHDLRAFQHAPIATLTIELAEPMTLAAPMLLLHEDRERGHYGQWLFQGQDPSHRLLHIVVSDAGTLMQQARETVLAGMTDQLRVQLAGTDIPAILRHALIIEKRATFLAIPGLKRPGNHTPWPGVWVAGDWTDTDYPAVLEAAVRSGRDAAMAADAAFQKLRSR